MTRKDILGWAAAAGAMFATLMAVAKSGDDIIKPRELKAEPQKASVVPDVRFGQKALEAQTGFVHDETTNTLRRPVQAPPKGMSAELKK